MGIEQALGKDVEHEIGQAKFFLSAAYRYHCKSWPKKSKQEPEKGPLN